MEGFLSDPSPAHEFACPGLSKFRSTLDVKPQWNQFPWRLGCYTAWLLESHLYVLAHCLGGKVTHKSSLQPFAGYLTSMRLPHKQQCLVQPDFMNHNIGVEVGTHVPQAWTMPT